MRVLALFLLLGASAPAIAADAGKDTHNRIQFDSNAREARLDLAKPNPNCRRTTSYLATQRGLYHGAPLTPRKLTELPPATTYMAVYRHIGECEAPLTMVEYRTAPRR